MRNVACMSSVDIADEEASEALSAGDNRSEPTWCQYALGVVGTVLLPFGEGEEFLTVDDAATDPDAAAFEASSFYQLQATAMRDSFAFWNDPSEDVYEDPDEL